MKGLSLHINRTQFRFRRWSRKAWAVFASLKRVISIGNLALQMVPGTILLERLTAFFRINSEEEDEVDSNELPEEMLLLSACLPVVAQPVIPGDCLLKNFDINQTVDAADVASTVSFLYIK